MAEKARAGKENPMREIKIEKVVINCCIGDNQDRLTRAATVLEEITQNKPVFAVARLTVRTFSIRRNQKIAAYVTVRGEKAHEIVNLALRCKDYELKSKNFSNTGNFGFGIEEHIELGVKYDPAVGIYGMDFYVVLTRAGARVSRKKHKQSRIGNNQRISKDEAISWVKKTFQTAIV
jgi:large subunit ribosomal protein L11e